MGGGDSKQKCFVSSSAFNLLEATQSDVYIRGFLFEFLAQECAIKKAHIKIINNCAIKHKLRCFAYTDIHHPTACEENITFHRVPQEYKILNCIMEFNIAMWCYAVVKHAQSPSSFFFVAVERVELRVNKQLFKWLASVFFVWWLHVVPCRCSSALVTSSRFLSTRKNKFRQEKKRER